MNAPRFAAFQPRHLASQQFSPLHSCYLLHLQQKQQQKHQRAAAAVFFSTSAERCKRFRHTKPWQRIGAKAKRQSELRLNYQLRLAAWGIAKEKKRLYQPLKVPQYYYATSYLPRKLFPRNVKIYPGVVLHQADLSTARFFLVRTDGYYVRKGVWKKKQTTAEQTTATALSTSTTRTAATKTITTTTTATAAATATATATATAVTPLRSTATPMLNFVQIITTPTADTPGTCLLVHHDNRRYLFGNIAEGTQRMFVQQKLSLSRTEQIFVTGTIEWRSTGGLLGLLLTVAEVSQASREDARKTADKKGSAAKKGGADKAKNNKILHHEAAAPKSLSIHGARNLKYMLATARSFIFRKGMPIDAHEIEDTTQPRSTGDEAGANTAADLRDPDWQDDNMMVWYVPAEKHFRPLPSIYKRQAQPSSPVSAGSADSSGSSGSPQSFQERWRAVLDERAEYNARPRKMPATALKKMVHMPMKGPDPLVDSVISNMFNSEWRMDALYETNLASVKMPAEIFVKDELTDEVIPYTGPPPTPGVPLLDLPVLVRRPWPASQVTRLPENDISTQAVSYIVRNHPRRGKVDAAAIARLRVPKADIRRLVAGETVTTPDGRVVTPDMIVGPTVEGAAFAVADLPSASYIFSFLARPEWADAKLMAAVDTMFWLLAPGLAADERLLDFMRKRPHIRHIVSAPDVCANRLALSSAAALQMKHHRIDPDRFPVQQYNNIAPSLPVPFELGKQPQQQAEAKTEQQRPSLPGSLPSALPFEIARPGWSVKLAPQVLEEDQKVIPLLDTKAAFNDVDSVVLDLAQKAHSEIASPEFQRAVDKGNYGLPYPDTEVIPLGTGSAMPSKYRNVSATLVRIPGIGSYLFDCGENTLGSMRRLFGEAGLADVLCDLRAIWISHLHADHHLGTASVIRAWSEATYKRGSENLRGGRGAAAAAADNLIRKNGGSEDSENNNAANRLAPEDLPRLAVISHVNMVNWLDEYAQVEDYGRDRVQCFALRAQKDSRAFDPVKLSPQLTAEFGFRSVDAVRVDHCHGAAACVFTWPDVRIEFPDEALTSESSQLPTSSSSPTATAPRRGPGFAYRPFRIAYSGDCRPSTDFAIIGREPALLIHESTFDDELAGEALAKKHCTMGEAIRVGRQMGARRLLLTHFSQRYPKIPVFGHSETYDIGLHAPQPDMRPSREFRDAIDRDIQDNDMQILVAFDHMRVKLNEFKTAAAFLPALQKLYEGKEV